MDERNVRESSPNRTKRVLSLALWLVLILAMAIGIAWLATRSVRHSIAPKEDFSNLFHIEVIVDDESLGVVVKDRWPINDSKRRLEVTEYLLSGTDQFRMGSSRSHLGNGRSRYTFRNQPRDKPIRVLIEYRVFDDSGPTPLGPVVTPPSSPLLYEGRQVSQIIDLPAIAREQPGWAKGYDGAGTGH